MTTRTAKPQPTARAKPVAAKHGTVRRAAPPPAAAAPQAAAEGGNGATAATAEKTKLVRDSFTMPAAEYESIARLKRRALSLGRPVKKSEVLRAGLGALMAMDDEALGVLLSAVPTIKTGRPKGKKAGKKS